ncbi:hypothetical protein [Saccharopolyspora sp. 5N708]|uniref:hypothetical protein n=1 Tax=Saccharopolyspora sp. 5N708 TaxID=3457424 RepID=UPI003FCF01CE
MSYSRRRPDWEFEYDPLAEFENLSYAGDPASGDDQRANAYDDTTDSDDAPVVIVHVSETGEVTSVALASSWRRSVDPRELHTSVLSAANAATMQVLANRIEGTAETSAVPASGTTADVPDTSPLGKEDVMRLLDAVSADLNDFIEQLSTRVEQIVSIRSSGGHVQGSARSGQILALRIDSGWASSARKSEIELELTEVLKQLGEQSSPGELAQGPRSRAIDELQALASDPQLLLRRVGLLP